MSCSCNPPRSFTPIYPLKLRIARIQIVCLSHFGLRSGVFSTSRLCKPHLSLQVLSQHQSLLIPEPHLTIPYFPQSPHHLPRRIFTPIKCQATWTRGDKFLCSYPAGTLSLAPTFLSHSIFHIVPLSVLDNLRRSSMLMTHHLSTLLERLGVANESTRRSCPCSMSTKFILLPCSLLPRHISQSRCSQRLDWSV